MALKDNLKEIHQKISAAAKRCGRDENEITLICVSKTIDADTINEAYNLGEKVFGENRVQELTEKYPLVNSDAQWHLIGHLQTNKVKYVVGKAELIHSVDSLHLAKAINTQAEKQGICQKILLEVNISGEESKYGLTTEEIPTIIEEAERIDLLKDMLTNDKENTMTEKTNENINTNYNENINTNIFTPSQDEEKYVTYRVYKVTETDTIDTIITKYNITKEMLSDYNNIENIMSGDKLIIPTNQTNEK